MHQPQQRIAASPHSLNGENTKHLFGGYFFPLYFFKRRCWTKLFKREFLQLMHLLKIALFSCAGKRLLPTCSATWRSQCCWACGGAKICSGSRDFTSSKGILHWGGSCCRHSRVPFFWGAIPGWSLLLLSRAGVQPRAPWIWNISLLPQLYSLGAKGNLRLLSSSASHFCGCRVPKGLKTSIPEECWAALVPGSVLFQSGLQDPAHWWGARCAQDTWNLHL